MYLGEGYFHQPATRSRLAPQLMDLGVSHFHQPATQSHLVPAADGFAGWLQPSAATRKLFFYLS